MTRKLTTMREFTLEMHEKIDCVHRFQEVVYKYAKFLAQKPELWMFVPCDEDGNVLEQPCDIMDTDECRDCACREHQKALSRVIFEGFEYDAQMEYWHNGHISIDEEFLENSTLEDLTPYNLTVKFEI
jgi:hypothetical protein